MNRLQKKKYYINNNFLLKPIYIAIYFSIFVFIRFYSLNQPFSYDSETYKNIFEKINENSFSEITENFIFPYVYLDGVVQTEFGFIFLSKFILSIVNNIEISYAIVASLSVGLRAYCMRKFGVPVVWIIIINIIAITLFEANAIRLGLASGFLLLGIWHVFIGKNRWGALYIFFASTFQIQVFLFGLPFLIFLYIIKLKKLSNFIFLIVLMFSGFFSFAAAKILPILNNEKVQFYIEQGISGSAGLTITSVSALLLIIIMTLNIVKKGKNRENYEFYRAILAATLPSIVILIIVTDISVIGDRAWQLAYIVISTLFFTGWREIDFKNTSFYLLISLTTTMFINVVLRYPLSNFFSPPFPSFNT